MDTGGYKWIHAMPPKAQLSQQEIDEIVACVDQVNALRLLSKKFKVGQGRIRRIWGEAGAVYREGYYSREKVGIQLTPERMDEMMTLATRLETEIKPWPANLDKVKGLPSLPDEQQLERYVSSLRIVNEASLDPGATRAMEDSYYNSVMINAFELLPKTLYTRFANTLRHERIHR